MKRISILFMALLGVAIAAAEPEAQCDECHSKNPALRKMHEALGYRDCMKCHGFGQVKSAPEERAAQMLADPLCSGCHRK